MTDPWATPRHLVKSLVALVAVETDVLNQQVLVFRYLDACRAAGGTPYVHWRAGRGRTGTVVGCYLVRRGLDGETGGSRSCAPGCFTTRTVCCFESHAIAEPQLD